MGVSDTLSRIVEARRRKSYQGWICTVGLTSLLPDGIKCETASVELHGGQADLENACHTKVEDRHPALSVELNIETFAYRIVSRWRCERRRFTVSSGINYGSTCDFLGLCVEQNKCRVDPKRGRRTNSRCDSREYTSSSSEVCTWWIAFPFATDLMRAAARSTSKRGVGVWDMRCVRCAPGSSGMRG